MRWHRITLALAACALMGTSAFAVFRAADMVVVPTAASGTGANSTVLRTDLEIMNVDTVAVDVQVVLLPCCGIDNSTWFDTIANVLGGRTEEGFGHVDARLAGIQPGAAVYLDDVVTTTWGASQTGALVVFAYEAGTLMTTTPPGGTPKLVIVNSRSYSLGSDTSGNPTTYGQQVPGLPWHDYIDPNKSGKGWDHAFITGFRQDANYSTSIGLVNISDRLTTLSVTLTLFAADGTNLSSGTLTLLPLEQEQFDQAYYSLFANTTDQTIQGGIVRAEVADYTTNSANPIPALLFYGSRVDNWTNDRSYLEQAWGQAFPWDCIFNGNCTAATGLALTIPTVHAKRQPLAPITPARRPVTRRLLSQG